MPEEQHIIDKPEFTDEHKAHEATAAGTPGNEFVDADGKPTFSDDNGNPRFSHRDTAY